MLQVYLPNKIQEILPALNDYLTATQVHKYLTVANSLKAIGTLGASYFVLKVVKILNERRKFAHIPGPETKG